MKRYMKFIYLLLFILILSGCNSINSNIKRSNNAKMDDINNSNDLEQSSDSDSYYNVIKADHTASEEKDSLVNLYYSMICDILAQATEFDSDTDMIALDLSQVFNLESEDQSTLAKKLKKNYNKECILATYDDLVAKDLIQQEDPYFTNGILITIVVEKETEKSFSFSLTKWRSGLCSITYTNCTARKNAGEWSYKLKGLSLSMR